MNKEELDATTYKLKVVAKKQKEKISEFLNGNDTIADIAELNQEIEELLLALSMLLK